MPVFDNQKSSSSNSISCDLLLDQALSAVENREYPAVRFNPVKQKMPIPVNRKIPWTSTGMHLDQPVDYLHDPLYLSGNYTVHESCAQFLEAIVTFIYKDTSPLLTLLPCSSYGDSVNLLSSMIDSMGVVVANESSRRHAEVLANMVSRWGEHNVCVTSQDPKKFSQDLNVYDLIILEPEKDEAYRTQFADRSEDEKAEHHLDLASSMWEALKPGGVMIYGTSSLSDKLTNYVVEQLENQFETGIVDVRELANKYEGVTINSSSVNISPGSQVKSGCTYVVIEKKEPTNKKNDVDLIEKDQVIVPVDMAALTDLQSMMETEFLQFAHFENQLYAMSEFVSHLVMAAPHMEIVQPGIRVGHFESNTGAFEYSFEFGFSCQIITESINSKVISGEDLIKLWHTGMLNSNDAQIDNGIVMLTSHGVNMGTANVVDGNIEVDFPSNWLFRSHENGHQIHDSVSELLEK